jgi:hypothetical protein
MPTPGIRIEKGHPTEEELAALTLLLSARAAALAKVPGDASDSRHPVAVATRWQPSAFHAPHSWQGAGSTH